MTLPRAVLVAGGGDARDRTTSSSARPAAVQPASTGRSPWRTPLGSGTHRAVPAHERRRRRSASDRHRRSIGIAPARITVSSSSANISSTQAARRLVVSAEQGSRGRNTVVCRPPLRPAAPAAGAGADRFERDHHRHVARVGRQRDVLVEVDDGAPVAAAAPDATIHAGIRSRLAASRASDPQQRLAEQRSATRRRRLVVAARPAAVGRRRRRSARRSRRGR